MIYTINVIGEEAGNTLQVLVNVEADDEEQACDKAADKARENHPAMAIKGFKVYER